MKTIGLIGGMSWESTIPYYKIINEKIKESLGGLHSGKIILYSVDFAEIEKMQSLGQWKKAAQVLGTAAQKLETAGADFILICTNTMHKIAPEIQSQISVPLIHIADATADSLSKDRINRVALLGTKYTMQEDFYTKLLKQRGFNVIIPGSHDIEIINKIIFDELCLGDIRISSRDTFSDIIANLKGQGAQAVILGCTEIGTLVRQQDSVLPLYDTTVIHATKAAELALKD